MNRERAKRLAKFLTVPGVMLLIVGLLSTVSMRSASAAPAAPKAAASVTTTAASEEPPTCVGVDFDQGSGMCGDVDRAASHSSSSAESHVVAVNGVSIHSTTKVVAYIQASGATKAQMRGTRYRLPRARCMQTSYWNTAHQEVWKNKCYAKGKLFIKGRDGYWHDPLCWNKVVGIPKGKTKVGIRVYGKVKIVKRFVFEAAATAKADEKVVAVAKAWCNTGNSHGYGEGNGSASAYAVASASFKGFVMTTVLATAKGMAVGNLQVKLGGQTVVEVRGQVRAEAFVKATAGASAWAECSSETDECPSVPGNQPPGYNCNPPTGEIVQFAEHLFPGGEYRYKVVGSDIEDGANVTLTYSVTGAATKIVDANHPEICDDEGTSRVCTFWVKAGSVPGNFTVTLVVTDQDGVQSQLIVITKPVVPDDF